MTPSSALLTFRPARLEEAGRIADLVNSGYRGDASRAGWTTEADLLEGRRTSEADLRQLIEAAHSMLFLCLQGEEIVGSVHLQKQGDAAYFGLFVVRPELQGQGIGRQFMAEAEAAAQSAWGVRRMTMTVISIRPELIAYYERRGYRRTGELRPFPTEAGESVPKVTGLQLAVLDKDLAPPH